jgi:3',5'-cyclic AMP phosphodiesterase CpdA
VSFAFLSDSHAYRIWANAQASDDPVDQVPLDVLSQTLTNAQEHDVDFIILGGDETNIHCVECPDVAVDGESGGTNTVRASRQAELRYLVWRRLYEEAGGDLPLFMVLGNHDGEAGFGNLAGDCGHYHDTAALSVGARKRSLPDPLRSYSGGNQGAYFSFVSGDALFVILDVMGGPSDYPQTPDDWTLGAAQLAWLETALASSREHWKFLIAHHIVGGHPRRAHCYAYGRGGVNTTRNEQSDGEFNGQQAAIHRLMLRYGAQFFLYGHDHIFSLAEKKDSNGRGEAVYYVAGGQSSRTPSEWLNRPWFQRLYDIDRDGIGDFLSVPGFLKVTLDAGHSARLQYILSDPQKPEQNGEVVFDRTINR